MTASFPFAFLAGLITVASPCIIPILPIVLSSALKRNRFYPLFMVMGLAFTFSLLGVVFGSLGSFIGIGKRTLEMAAIILLGVTGLVIVIKPLSAAFSQWTCMFLSSCTPASGPSESPFQAFVVGSTLGIIWVPCAGPVLASILALAAASRNVVEGFLLLFTYAVGASIPILLIAYGGQRALIGRRCVQQHAEQIRLVFGWILIVTAILLYFGIFKQLQAFLVPYFLSYFPAFITTF